MNNKELANKIASSQAPAVIDVRTGFEFRAGHIPGAVNAPIWKILMGCAPLPRDKHAAMVVLCELGPRAVMARMLLSVLGYSTITLLDGHMAQWRRAGLPQEK